MAPVDSFSRKDTRKPEAQLEDGNVSRIEFLVAVSSLDSYYSHLSYSPQRAEKELGGTGCGRTSLFPPASRTPQILRAPRFLVPVPTSPWGNDELASNGEGRTGEGRGIESAFQTGDTAVAPGQGGHPLSCCSGRSLRSDFPEEEERMVCGEMGGRLLPWRVQRTLKATSPWKPSQVPSLTHNSGLAWSRIQRTASLVPNYFTRMYFLWSRA